MQAKDAKGQYHRLPLLFDEKPKAESQQIYHGLQRAAARLSLAQGWHGMQPARSRTGSAARAG